ncbi:MAG: membrane protein insertase YidC [Bacilli bacterium]|nr:membrane protein insertase YidC [Bacilli bacterium]
MKRRTKLGLALVATGFGVAALSSCTASFCSAIDISRMKYAFEPGIIRIVKSANASDEIVFHGETNDYTIKGATLVTAEWVPSGNDTHVGNYVFNYYDPAEEKQIEKELTFINNIIKSARDSGVKTIDGNAREYMQRFDFLALNAIFGKVADLAQNSLEYTYEEQGRATVDRDLSYYSYLRFYSGGADALDNWNKFDVAARDEVDPSSPLANLIVNYGVSGSGFGVLSPDVCPSSDFVKGYHNQLNSWAATFRTCLTTKTDKYGSYGYSTEGIYINEKTWGDAWSKGFFEGLLVYPIGWLVDSIVLGFRGTGVSAGLAALLGIVFVTFIIRTLMLLATWKQTQSNAKMTELQPEIQKIQNKYPNSNTSKAEKARMGQEMQALYKKNHVNPFITIIVLIVQFPVFICVWGALSGSSLLSSGTFLGLNLSMTIKDALFTGANWTAAGGYAAVTALFLFLLMAGAQTVSMLLPQWIQKKKAKQVAKLGKNPAQKQQNNRMKWFTYIMLALIIFMGFSLASAMGVYWLIGAIFSIIQTVVIQVITERKAARK